MEKEKKALLKDFIDNKRRAANLLAAEFKSRPKSSEASEKFRKDANDLFMQKGHCVEVHRDIFTLYCQSIINAPNGSEQLAFAYGNRSAFLLHIKKYEDCIKDCNRVLKIDAISDVFKIKMLCRKAECLKKLNLPEFQSVMQEAESFENQIADDSKKKSLTDIINKVKNLSINKKSHSKSKNAHNIQLDEMLNGIKIENDKKYGRHLIATKDYNPGDVILVENLFATTVKKGFSNTHCHYCLKLCWSGIPCKNCSSAIFCSEDCRHKAWKLFHDIECSLINSDSIANENFAMFDTVIRAVITGIREAGSIAQLRADLKSIDRNDTDQCSKGFIKDGEFTKNRIESTYVLNTDRVPDNILESMASCASMFVIGMANCSDLFPNSNLKDVNEFIKDKDVIFIGSLIVKIMAVKSVNDCSITPKQLYACEKSSSLAQCMESKDVCCSRGSCFMPISSLVSHNCFPNASRCFSEDRKIILYAVLPIKKNTQIFNSYSCEFDDVEIEQRKQILQKYEISCDCQACTESWPPILHLSEELLEKHNYAISGDFQNKLYEKCSHIFNALNIMGTDFNERDIKLLSGVIAVAIKLKQPSLLICYLTESLKRVVSHVYGLQLQLPLYGKCR